MRVVISYKNADLDGVASAYAYSEYLNKKGITSSYYIKYPTQNEVAIVCNLFNINLTNYSENLSKCEISITDTNTMTAVDFVPPDNVVEIIDHHPASGDEFKNAEVKLYEVGAVCTVIAELFKNDNIYISRDAAILLYYGIISNTLNFNSDVTTEKDLEMANWLKSQCPEIDENIIRKFFEEKSKIDKNNLRFAMEVEEKFQLGENELIIGQLEITEATEFLKKWKDDIDHILDDVMSQYHVSFAFVNVLDIRNGYHIIYTPFQKTQKFLRDFCDIPISGDSLIGDKPVLRKEIKYQLRSNYRGK